jgi:hypothetical protein
VGIIRSPWKSVPSWAVSQFVVDLQRTVDGINNRLRCVPLLDETGVDVFRRFTGDRRLSILNKDSYRFVLLGGRINRKPRTSAADELPFSAPESMFFAHIEEQEKTIFRNCFILVNAEETEETTET